MISADELNRRVEVRTMADQAAAVGGTVAVESTVVPRWAAIEPLSARELIRAAQTQMRATTKITMRWFDGLTTKDRIVWRDRGRERVFEIESLVDTDTAHVEWVALCVESG